MKMTSVKLTPEEAKEDYGSPISDAELPKYPYGLSISMNDETMKKLGIAALPSVGSKMMLMASCVVTNTGESEYQGSEKEMRFELQITEMALTPEKQTVIEMAHKLYGDGK